ncbi:concanavalin A-like lectin/glucanase superfamily protein [Ancylomarina subtilis]|uniref:Concanavalin A-like lectin/glucanase superfamily protein n=1 Tax=Ancylomarina subtilis TaxID=1639035 RepID=A0A4Q7V649_9BACT|nr:hypothetical protein [Ancylomarina subtilis]RZT91314.1 concanavalin A-like lectin/glucanase superfamily protein [Ancylomarina subtilis]
MNNLKQTLASIILFCVCSLLVNNISAQNNQTKSLRFTKNETGKHEYANIANLPSTFGVGEFTLEMWIKPDNSFPVGPTPWPQDPFPLKQEDVNQWAKNEDQLTNWSNSSEEPYSSTGWWWHGNWLLDGFSRNYGDRDGSFALQFYGGGRLRWLFDDGTGPSADKGYVYSVGVYPATETPSLLDGKWHNIQCVRRWIGKSEAQLELWVDGKIIDKKVIPTRVDMQKQFWNDWGVGNPPGLKGWLIGGEEQASSGVLVDYYWHQFEDYKGLVDELRFWNKAKSQDELQKHWNKAITKNIFGLVGYYSFENINIPSNYLIKDKIEENKAIMSLHKFDLQNLSNENAPIK